MAARFENAKTGFKLWAAMAGMFSTGTGSVYGIEYSTKRFLKSEKTLPMKTIDAVMDFSSVTIICSLGIIGYVTALPIALAAAVRLNNNGMVIETTEDENGVKTTTKSWF